MGMVARKSSFQTGGRKKGKIFLAQEFSAIDKNFIGPVRQRAGYNIPVGNRPPTQVGFTPARRELPGFHGTLAGGMNVPSNFQPQRSLLYRASAGSNARKRGVY